MKKDTGLRAVRWKKAFYRLSMLGVPVIMLPVIMLGCAITVSDGFHANDPSFPLVMRYFAQNLLGGIFAWLLTLLADKIRQKDIDNARFALFANLLMGAGMLLALAAFAIFNFSPTAPFVISLIAIGVSYFLVWKKSPKDYSAIIDKKMLTAYCVLSLIAVIAFWAMKVSYSRMTLVWGLFYLASCYALSQDQSNIDFMMERRKHKLEHLPDAVRGRSLKLTLAVIAAGFICVRLAPQFGWLFSQLFTGIKVILLAVFRFIWNLIPAAEPSEEVEETITSEPGGFGGMGASDEGSPWWDYIMWPLLTLAVCWLIYTYRDDIMRSLITFWRTLRQKVKGALFSSSRRAGITADGEGEYEDEVVELSAEEVKENRDASSFKLRQWKKAVRLWHAQPDTEEKYREGYRLALDWLLWKKVPLTPSDTPLAVLEKAKATLSLSDWEAVTDWYNLIRYGEPFPFPEASVPILAHALEEMEKAK